MQGVLNEKLLTELDGGLYGLLHVLSLYLSGGSEDLSSKLGPNIKNYAPLLNRAGVNTFVGEVGLLGVSAVNLLKNEKDRGLLIKILADANKRDGSEPVLTVDKGTPRVAAWLEQVLSGQGDPPRSHGRSGAPGSSVTRPWEGKKAARSRLQGAAGAGAEKIPLRPDLVPSDQLGTLASATRRT